MHAHAHDAGGVLRGAAGLGGVLLLDEAGPRQHLHGVAVDGDHAVAMRVRVRQACGDV